MEARSISDQKETIEKLKTQLKHIENQIEEIENQKKHHNTENHILKLKISSQRMSRLEISLEKDRFEQKLRRSDSIWAAHSALNLKIWPCQV